jgi:PAS domain S-box-containing protein
MERTLKATEYRLLVEHSPVLLWRAGLDANCDYFNETWLSFTGRSLEQELGSGWAAGVHPDDLDGCLAFYLDHFQRREAFEMEYRLRRHDGIYRWILDRGVPFTDEGGAFAGFIGSCVDVDGRRQMQDAHRRSSEEQLAAARDFEKWVLAIVGHDIRNPLNSIHLSALGLRALQDPTGTAKRHADIVARGVSRIQHIVSDLLDLARERENAGIPVNPAAADLGAICRQVIEELRVVALDRTIQLDCAVDGTGRWDEHRILQAVSNLVSNAVQHGKPGSPVRIKILGDAQCVIMAVENEGAIPREFLPHLFEPFRSVRNHANRGDGLGLGLFIAKAIARAHGGTLEVDVSESATVFRLTLPRFTPDRGQTTESAHLPLG